VGATGIGGGGGGGRKDFREDNISLLSQNISLKENSCKNTDSINRCVSLFSPLKEMPGKVPAVKETYLDYSSGYVIA
jgi:hypothetical protein